MRLVDAVGWAGAGCLLLAYALLSGGRLTVDVPYHLLNLAGAAGLAVNGAAHGAWPSAALNVVWFGIGALALRRRPVRSADAPSAGPSVCCPACRNQDPSPSSRPSPWPPPSA